MVVIIVFIINPCNNPESIPSLYRLTNLPRVVSHTNGGSTILILSTFTMLSHSFKIMNSLREAANFILHHQQLLILYMLNIFYVLGTLLVLGK